MIEKYAVGTAQSERVGRMLAKFLLAVLLLGGAFVLPVRANDVVGAWQSVKAPAAPELKAVTVDHRTTALLLLDFMKQNCGARPPCVATLPAMKRLLTQARAAKATVIYSIIANSTTADVMADVAPIAGEPHVQAGPDKFLRSNLDAILKEKGIRTVIVSGTASNGAVLFTGAGAAFRGMNVIVPIDGMSADDPYADYSTVFTFMNAPQVSTHATLTRSDMITFR